MVSVSFDPVKLYFIFPGSFFFKMAYAYNCLIRVFLVHSTCLFFHNISHYADETKNVQVNIEDLV